MADKRLQDIRTSDDAESTVNVELIEWLKTSGVNYLLFVLVIVVCFRGWLWWGERQDRIRDEAWADLSGTDSPASLEALADRAKGIDSVPELALLRAADLYHLDILRDRTLDLVPDVTSIGDPNEDPSQTSDEPDKPTPPMTEGERTQTLDRMERIYQRVYESTKKPGSGTHWKELMHIQSMFGLAAVAEMRGDFDKAEEWFTQIEAQAGSRYDELGKVALAWKNDPAARTRIEFLEESVVNAALRDLPVVTAPANTPGDEGIEQTGTEPNTDAETPPAEDPVDRPAEDSPAEEKPGSGDGG